MSENQLKEEIVEKEKELEKKLIAIDEDHIKERPKSIETDNRWCEIGSLYLEIKKMKENLEKKENKSLSIFKEYFIQMQNMVKSNIKSSQLILRELQRFEDVITFIDKCPIYKKKK